MKTINIALEVEAIKKKVIAAAKKHSTHSTVDIDEVVSGSHVYYICVEGPPSMLDTLEEIIGKSKYTVLIKASHHPGHYDWTAGAYIKDCDHVTFRF